MPASPTSPIRMATDGCYRNGATAMCDVVWRLGDVDHARRSRNTQERIGADTLFSVLFFSNPCRYPPSPPLTIRAKGVPMGTVKFRKVDVDGIKVFYREAGPKDAPTILLLHGFPTAGHMFRDLIPQLADRFRLVAPDLPAFGQSDMPARGTFTYTFENIANVIDRFTEVIGLHRFAIYVFDYGAPVGFRLAVRHPD